MSARHSPGTSLRVLAVRSRAPARRPAAGRLNHTRFNDQGGDHVVVAVDVEYLGLVQFGGRGDDQVRYRPPVRWWRRCARRRSLHHCALSGESCGKTICRHVAASASVLRKQMVHHGAPAARRPAWLPRIATPGARGRQGRICRASRERRDGGSTFAALPRSALRRPAATRSPFCPALSRRRSVSDNSDEVVDYSRELKRTSIVKENASILEFREKRS